MLYALFYKSGQNWRQIINIKDVNFCEIAAGGNGMSLFKAIIDFYKKVLPNLPSKCPVLPGKYSVKNATVSVSPKNEFNMTMKDFQNRTVVPYQDMWAAMSPTLMPNGLYRSIVRVYNQQDPIGFSMYWVSEVNHRWNDQDF